MGVIITHPCPKPGKGLSGSTAVSVLVALAWLPAIDLQMLRACRRLREEGDSRHFVFETGSQ